ncbi:thioredoxin-domain-containing protein [Fistulina hepatica ATCC 64428]|uniref:Thioredoxin n=1 Tax=Fistulina hepatica ATCC 64428 TaxID=1128425 RepID=A0A0D7AC35_9AGAR|nr:thioredoxin-domain-containing protein [Fistulina hepatica ATCC 64428]
MSITHLTSVSQLNSILAKSAGRLSVIDFHATWCGPCHAIAPVYESLAKQYPNVNFLKCDVDAAKDVAAMYNVSAMPTFVFLKGDTKVHQIRGADRSGLETAVQRYSSGSAAGGATAAFSGKGQTLGSATTAGNNDPNTKLFLGLVVGYFVFWYLS